MSPNFEDAAGYERTTAVVSRQVAQEFVPWLGVRRDGRWLDCGCGTGALTCAILDLAWPGEVTGVDRSEAFLEQARRAAPGVRFEVGDITQLPFPDARFDAVVAGAVLHHVGDPAAAVAEMARVAAPGGTVGAYGWSGVYGLVRPYSEAAERVGLRPPQLPGGDQSPEAVGALFVSAGLAPVQTALFAPQVAFASFDDWWDAILGRRWWVSEHFAELAPDLQERLRAAAREIAGEAPRLVSPAWAAKGRR